MDCCCILHADIRFDSYAWPRFSQIVMGQPSSSFVEQWRSSRRGWDTSLWCGWKVGNYTKKFLAFNICFTWFAKLFCSRYIKCSSCLDLLVSESKLWVGLLFCELYGAYRWLYTSVSVWTHPLKSSWMIFVVDHFWEKRPLQWPMLFGCRDAIGVVLMPCSIHHFGEYTISRKC